jgi:hypothetical protein
MWLKMMRGWLVGAAVTMGADQLASCEDPVTLPECDSACPTLYPNLAATASPPEEGGKNEESV